MSGTFNYRGQGAQGSTGPAGQDGQPGPTLNQQHSTLPVFPNPPTSFKGLFNTSFGIDRLSEAEDDYAADGTDNLQSAHDLLGFIQLIADDNRS